MEAALFLLCLSVIQTWYADMSTIESASLSTSTSVSISTPVLTTPVPINCSTWDVTNTTIKGYIYGNITSATAKYDKELQGSINAPIVTFFNLLPGCNYNISIQSSSGTACLDMEATIAALVNSVTVNPLNSTSLNVSWTNAAGCIKSYSGSVNGSDFTTMGNYQEVHGLQPGCTYDAIIITEGYGKSSAPAKGKGATVAALVNSVTVNAINSTSLNVSWTNATGCVTNYSGSINGSNFTTMDNNEEVHDLQPGCKYLAKIITEGYGPNSSEVQGEGATVAASVNNVTVNPINSTSLNVSWTNATGCMKSYSGSVNGSNFTTMENYQEVRGLQPGCTYDAIIITEGYGKGSAPAKGKGATVAASVSNVTITALNSTALRVNWTTATGCVTNYSGSVNGSNFTTMKNYQEVHGLLPGCKYDAKIITEGYGPISNVTVGEGATVALPVKSLNITAKNATLLVAHWATPVGCVRNFLLLINNSNETTKENSMEFHNLKPGHSYTVRIIVNGFGKPSREVNVTTNTYPSDLVGVTCGYASSGYGIALSWPPPYGKWTRVEVQLDGQSLQNVTGSETRVIIDGVQPANSYTISLQLYSGDLSSAPVVINCTTDPRGIIAGVLVAVLILLMVILAVVVLRHKPKCLRQKWLTESEVTNDKFKVVPVGKFAEHFHKLSCDQNRGFSEEYENLSTAGVDQPCHTALIPENKAKNRFTNVLPYDSSRVKLTTKNRDMNSDYINANYMPGYGNNNRQYIAAQGPLPNTVNDFWRMIWEQDVTGVVMVTNCNEGGKVKCEQYWPENSLPQTYGNLAVKVTSEHKDMDWTRREFNVRNMKTSEVRLVKHFHFTAWPDHGVPSGTSALMEFRGIVRHHVESCCSLAPMVVHCSAGVGRTGTLIALDVALQQLEMERAVGLAAFVRKMRLNRPLMVQTESQYIFLHQCIMDKLKKGMKTEEPVYENTDMIYVNSVALRDFVEHNPKS
ncbi:receptor-type tyrosine-protein phosphatase H-like isoform X3 [Brienomyrus brachyistius]|uniref:receptor-type tyrosine-protein phosphatase H-like isoform X3 n=1 Tax=Brienomyrus brachyistius TaxID=42636 RepID=UPI0020B327AC|nr:receptor-type tyrosine-protein phosphatase H-like isoform X3 [Brienomyrus brachyistius]